MILVSRETNPLAGRRGGGCHVFRALGSLVPWQHARWTWASLPWPRVMAARACRTRGTCGRAPVSVSVLAHRPRPSLPPARKRMDHLCSQIGKLARERWADSLQERFPSKSVQRRTGMPSGDRDQAAPQGSAWTESGLPPSRARCLWAAAARRIPGARKHRALCTVLAFTLNLIFLLFS